jgi:hypothetical protein
LGVSHGVFVEPPLDAKTIVVWSGPDPVLDRLFPENPSSPARSRAQTWYVVRYPDALPSVRVATTAERVRDWDDLFRHVLEEPLSDTVWYIAEAYPPDDDGRRATSARLLSWDGRTAVVDHDGTCDLVVNRTYYPGWVARVNDGPKHPVRRAEAGVQSVRLPGRGLTRVTFQYRPTRLAESVAVTTGAVIVSLIVIAFSLQWTLRDRRLKVSRRA